MLSEFKRPDPLRNFDPVIELNYKTGPDLPKPPIRDMTFRIAFEALALHFSVTGKWELVEDGSRDSASCVDTRFGFRFDVVFGKLSDETNSVYSIAQRVIANRRIEDLQEVVDPVLILSSALPDGTLHGNLRFRVAENGTIINEHAAHLRIVGLTGVYAVLIFSNTLTTFSGHFERVTSKTFESIEVHEDTHET